MKTCETVAQMLSIICGLYAAYVWWRASRVGGQLLKAPPEGPQGDGNQLLQLDDGSFVLYDFAKQAALNMRAAFLTAVAVALQAIALAAHALQ
jgi:hypothetical protein